MITERQFDEQVCWFIGCYQYFLVDPTVGTVTGGLTLNQHFPSCTSEHDVPDGQMDTIPRTLTHNPTVAHFPSVRLASTAIGFDPIEHGDNWQQS